MDLYAIYQHPSGVLFILFVLLVWSMIWQGIALWFSAKNQQKGWFVALFILNTVGILPIVYLFWFKPREKTEVSSKRVTRRK